MCCFVSIGIVYVIGWKEKAEVELWTTPYDTWSQWFPIYFFWFVCLCNLVTFIYESLSSVVHTGRPVLALSRHLCIIAMWFFGKIESSSVNCFISVLYLFSLIWLFIIFYRVSFATKVKSWTKWVEASAQKTENNWEWGSSSLNARYNMGMLIFLLLPTQMHYVYFFHPHQWQMPCCIVYVLLFFVILLTVKYFNFCQSFVSFLWLLNGSEMCSVFPLNFSLLWNVLSTPLPPAIRNIWAFTRRQ